MSLYSEDQLYVAKHKGTGFYSSRVIYFLMGEMDWMRRNNPSIEEVIEQIDFINSRKSIWVEDINNAEPWSSYNIGQYGKYLLDAEFVPVELGISNVQPNGWGKTTMSEK